MSVGTEAVAVSSNGSIALAKPGILYGFHCFTEFCWKLHFKEAKNLEKDRIGLTALLCIENTFASEDEPEQV